MTRPPFPAKPAFLATLALLGALAGCNAIGPSVLRSGRQDYNEVVQQTASEQLLLNLVRLRYLEPPLFLEVASVTASYQMESGLGVGASVPNQGAAAGTVFSPTLRAAFLEKPTISFVPLQGDKFVTQLLAPISIDKLLLLFHSGWSVERILRVCVQRLNGLENAPSASGPTPLLAPTFKQFLALTRQLRALQLRGQLDLASAGEEQKSALVLLIGEAAEGSEELTAIRAALGAAPDARRFVLRAGVGKGENGTLTLQTRSLLGSLFYVSQGVRVADEDVEAGRVPITLVAGGGPFDWDELLGDLFRVQVDSYPDAGASVAVYHRGRRFTISDADLGSKSTFAFLSQLFALQAGNASGQSPLLTLSVGN